MIRVSAGEFAATLTKACLGAGVERGIALELGLACMELSLLGRRSIPVLIEQLQAGASNAGYESWEKTGEEWTVSNIATLPDAVSMIDFAMISEAGSRVANVHAPTLVLGLALNRMRCHGLILEILLGDGTWTNVIDVTVDLSNELEPCSVALRQAASSSGVSQPDIVAIDVLEEDWASLAPWVAKTLVKADETNRADAGAGNTDND